MTVTELPLASATPAVVPTRPGVNAPVNARARVDQAVAKVKTLLANRVVSVVLADVRGWWLLAAAPTSLGAWLAGQSPATRRVPAGNGLLRAAWVAHNWTLGLIAAALSVALFLAAGALRWLACHPVRLWAALIVTAATVTALLYL